MSRKITRQRIYNGYFKHITGKPVTKDIRTKPIVKSGDPESKVLKDCMSWLRRNGVLASRNNVGFGDLRGTGKSYHYGIKDAGDIICHLQGRYCEVECKHGNGGIWKLNQQQHAEKVKQSGGLYFVVHSVDELSEKTRPYLTKEFLL